MARKARHGNLPSRTEASAAARITGVAYLQDRAHADPPRRTTSGFGW